MKAVTEARKTVNRMSWGCCASARVRSIACCTEVSQR